MSRPLICEVSIAALRHNFEAARCAANSSPVVSQSQRVKVWSVVKANAYGHGLEAALAAFDQSDGLALVEFDYAARLRSLGWSKPILMLEGAFDLDDTKLARALRLTLTVHQPRQMDWLIQSETASVEGSLDVWIKLNTGMNRLGFSVDELPATMAQCNELVQHKVNVQGLMTHFANSDLSLEQSDAVAVPLAKQQEAFLDCFAQAKKQWPRIGISLSNSSAVVGYPSVADDLLPEVGSAAWVRPGVMLYGATPYADLTRQSAVALGLKPAMALKSQVIAVQNIKQGDSIGYGSRFIAPKNMKIGVVACGYADGYPRHAPDGTPVLVSGQRSRVVGRVSMDMLVIDMTDIENAELDAQVELWGANLPIDEVAHASGTIGYELMCAVAERVARKTIVGFLE